jgi:hypothetical protein
MLMNTSKKLIDLKWLFGSIVLEGCVVGRLKAQGSNAVSSVGSKLKARRLRRRSAQSSKLKARRLCSRSAQDSKAASRLKAWTVQNCLGDDKNRKMKKMF